ncbi:MAG TPA: recombinase family protein, partial [Streptosporangiaceae bacterium]|nr:recombinase family protein [Streptosporangiaceae bacterium]
MTERQDRAAIWSRVSTDEQTTANQRGALADLAERRGWQVVATYDADGVSAWTGAHRLRLAEALA